MIYLDNAATTYPKPECVYKALDRANREMAFNSGRGSYKQARYLSNKITETRQLIADIVAANQEEVILKTSATSALNNIILGLNWKEGDNIYVSPFEHNAVMRPLEHIRKTKKVNIVEMPFDKQTWYISEKTWDMFALKKPKCIICSAKSNVTGYSLPTKEIFKEGKKYNSINILDASQSFGIDKKITKEDTDFIVFAGHKSLYATFGIAGFLKTSEIELEPTEFGGTGSDSLNLNMPTETPAKYECSSKNTVAIIGLNESLKWLKEIDIEQKEKQLTEYLYTELKKIDKVIIYTPKDEKKCTGIISINVQGYNAEEVGTILDEEYNIAVRTGYHCAPLIHRFIESDTFNGTVRISLNYFNTSEEISKLIEALKTL